MIYYDFYSSSLLSIKLIGAKWKHVYYTTLNTTHGQGRRALDLDLHGFHVPVGRVTELEDLGFDYASDPAISEHDVLLIVDGPGDQVAVHLTATRDDADVAGCEQRLRQTCVDCEIEFLALAPA